MTHCTYCDTDREHCTCADATHCTGNWAVSRAVRPAYNQNLTDTLGAIDLVEGLSPADKVAALKAAYHHWGLYDIATLKAFVASPETPTRSVKACGCHGYCNAHAKP